jgi:hypothetical protein
VFSGARDKRERQKRWASKVNERRKRKKKERTNLIGKEGKWG